MKGIIFNELFFVLSKFLSSSIVLGPPGMQFLPLRPAVRSSNTQMLLSSVVFMLGGQSSVLSSRPVTDTQMLLSSVTESEPPTRTSCQQPAAHNQGQNQSQSQSYSLCQNPPLNTDDHLRCAPLLVEGMLSMHYILADVLTAASPSAQPPVFFHNLSL